MGIFSLMSYIMQIPEYVSSHVHRKCDMNYAIIYKLYRYELKCECIKMKY